MRIWQCTRLNPKGVGGVEKHISEVSASLTRMGHTVHIGPTLPEDWQDGSPIIAHTHGDSWPSPFKLRSSTWIHVCHGTSVGRVLACREYFSFSGWRGSFRDFYPTHIASATIAVGQSALDEARRYFRMNLRSVVIPNGANPTFFKPLQSVEPSPRIIFVGRSDDRVKNIPALLDACSSIAETISSFELWAAPGIAPEKATRLNIRNLGTLDSAELASALSQCRALVLCSFYEGDPIVLREAKALGLPVIVSNIPQIRNTLGNYPNVTFVDPRSKNSIQDGIEKSITGQAPSPSPQLRSWDEVAFEFDSFYKSISTKIR